MKHFFWGLVFRGFFFWARNSRGLVVSSSIQKVHFRSKSSFLVLRKSATITCSTLQIADAFVWCVTLLGNISSVLGCWFKNKLLCFLTDVQMRRFVKENPLQANWANTVLVVSINLWSICSISLLPKFNHCTAQKIHSSCVASTSC